MASVHLDFTPPDQEDLDQLVIYESVSPDGPWASIEIIDDIGEYPDYISEYTTAEANATSNYFAIDWIDTNGANVGLSNAIQGGTETLIGEIIHRVLRRDPELDEVVVSQEAKVVMDEVFRDVPDPTIENTSSKVLSAVTLLTMARVYEMSLIEDSGNGGWVSGLVSIRNDPAALDNKLKAIDRMVQQALRELGWGGSRVAQILMPPIINGLSEIVSADISRLQIEVE